MASSDSAPYLNWSITKTAVLLLALFPYYFVFAARTGCEFIVAVNLTELESTFHECGAAVLQLDALKPPIQTLADSFLGREGSIETKTTLDYFTAEELYFSPAVRPVFGGNLTFPPVTLLVATVKRSVDVEVCLSSSIPCTAEEYRFVELESHDLVVIDPSRSRMRICDPSHSSAGCSLPKDSNVEVLRFHSPSFELGKEPDARPVQEEKDHVIVGNGMSWEDYLALASDMAKKRQFL